jgi:hypothetical protein
MTETPTCELVARVVVEIVRRDDCYVAAVLPLGAAGLPAVAPTGFTPDAVDLGEAPSPGQAFERLAASVGPHLGARGAP